MCNAARRSSGEEVRSAGRRILGSACPSERTTSHRGRTKYLIASPWTSVMAMAMAGIFVIDHD